MRLFAIIGAVAMLATAGYISPAHAQDAEPKPRAKYCWRGRQKPVCDAFLITEFGFYRSIVSPSAKIPSLFTPDSLPQYYYTQRETPWNFTWEIGGMVNRDARSAIGATLLLGANGDGGTVGVKARYRRWLNPEGIALDVGLGVRTSGIDRGNVNCVPYYDYRSPGTSPALTTDVAINAKDYVALVGRVDVLRYGGRYQPNIALGARLGSRPAVIGTGALATTYAALITLFLLAWDD